MVAAVELPVEERIFQVMKHLGIRQAHFAASNPSDWRGLVSVYTQLISTLTLLSPRAIDERILGPIALRLLVFKNENIAVVHQHDPNLLDNGNILIFENGWHTVTAPSPGSRIIEVNPKTNGI